MKNIGTINKTYTVDDLNQRIDVYTGAKTVGSKGNTTYTYKDTADMSLWASVLPYSARTDVEQSTSVVRETNYHIVVRYRTDITGHDKIVWNGKSMVILGEPFNVDGCNRWLQIECKERS